MENLADPNEEQPNGQIEQPNSAPFSTIIKPSLGKSMRVKGSSPRNAKKMLFVTSEPAQFTPDTNNTKFLDIIDKIEEKDQKEITKLKSDSKRKKTDSNSKKA